MPLQLGNLTIQAFLYVPLFSYSPSGTSFILDSTSNPCQVGLNVTTSDTFAVDGVTFTALQVDAQIYLAKQDPTFTMTFVGLTGAPSGTTGVYHSLADLLDSQVQAWIGEVIVQGSYWLNMYVGSTDTTVGQILVAANFLTVDNTGTYHFDPTNLQGQSATDIALNFVFTEPGLDALANLEVPLLGLGGGIFVAYDDTTGDMTACGSRRRCR